MVDIPVSANVPVTIKAQPALRYQLIDATTGMAPDNIRVKRMGKDLAISFEGVDGSSLVISDYYENTVEGFNALVGEAETGVYHAYTPETGQLSATVANLSDGGNPVGMALGGDQVTPSGAAVGALVGAAGFNPLLIAPLALLGAGKGGASSPHVTPPQVTAAKLASEDDTGVSNSDGITKDNTPRLLIDADANAVSATVTVAGKTYTSTTKNAQGQFVVQIPDTEPLSNGSVDFSVVVKDAAGYASTAFVGTSFVVDTSVDQNFQPPAADTNKGVPAQIMAISDDTGVSASDFNTSDNTLIFKGTVAAQFVKNGDVVELYLLDALGGVVASQYVEPVNAGGQWTWTWDNRAQKLPDGQYKLSAQVVDKAGNAVGADPALQDITIDTNANPDANASFAIAVMGPDQDSGVSSTDDLTNRTQLSFKGNIGTSNANFTGKVLVQILDVNGKIQSESYVDPSANGAWAWDNTANTLGVPNASTQYLVKASIVDLAGNILKSTDQSFTVDLKAPVFSMSGGSTTTQSSYLFDSNNPMKLTVGTASGAYADAEPGTFTFWNGQTPISAPNPVGGASLSYDPGHLTITYTDLAGNSSSMTNVTTWVFSAGIAQVLPSTSSSPLTFSNGELAGSIGKYILAPDVVNFDVSALHTTAPHVGDVAAINHISLSGNSTVANADHTLTLGTADVLALGVKNSFLSAGVFKDQQQMRIDGDAGDKVLLSDLVGGSHYHWTEQTSVQVLNGSTYRVFSNTDLGLELLIQQSVQITQV